MYSAIAQRVPIVIAEQRKARFVRHAVVSTLCLMFLFGPSYAANSLGFLQRAQTVAVVRAVQQAAEVRSLEVGPLILRELKGGQSHTYEISIAAGQYANVVVDQKGIDVVVKLFAPDGKLITEVDSPNGTLGPEPVYVIAETTGIYRLEIGSLEKDATPGKYEAKLVELRSVTERDKTWLAARRVFEEGVILTNQNTSESSEAAIKKYEAAFSLYGAIGDRSEQHAAMISMGITYRLRRKWMQSFEHFERAFQIAKELGDDRRQALSLENMSDVQINNDQGKALQFGDEALKKYQAIGDRDKEAYMLGRVAEIHYLWGEEEKARDLYSQLLLMYQSLGDKTGEALTLRSISSTYDVENEAQKSLEYSLKAVAIWQSLEARKQEAVEQSTISNYYARLGERQKALDSAEKALSLGRGDKDTEAQVMVNVGTVYYKLGDIAQALTLYNEGWSYFHNAGHTRSEAITLRHTAIALRDLGRLNEAQVKIEKSIALVEVLRDHAGSPELQSSFIATLFPFYELYIDILMRQHAVDPKAGHNVEALAFTEKVKARNLVDLLTQARVTLKPEVAADLMERERTIAERLTVSLDALTALLKSKYTEAQKSEAQRKIDALESERRRVQAEIRERGSRSSAITKAQPLSIPEIQQQVLDGNTLLLEYELGNDSSYLWAMTPDGVQSYRLPPRAEVEAQARRVYQLLIARQPEPGLAVAQQRARETTADAQFQTQASLLSKMLLGPVAAQLGTKRLLIVADGALEYLPFSALPAPATQETESKAEAKPLILVHEIVSLPSASVLALLRSEFATREPANKMVAVLADPVFEIDDARVKISRALNKKGTGTQNQMGQAVVSSSDSSTVLKRALNSVRGDEGRSSLRRLLFSRDEAEAILSALPPQQGSLKALDFRANRNTAMSDELSQYRIIHFSTHGLLDSRHPELSGLVLSLFDEDGHAQEGFLRLNEIYNLHLNADLVVLSACQTGLGKEVRGEGLMGLVRGFMYAGSPRVVASLWQVDDAATAELMKRFYRGMFQEKLPPSAALRAAQIEMLKRKHWQSPYYWGAFVLQGEWR
jgi:CHAT domain-containing protein/tetratricopeptide (TPR) repeat protein